MKSPLTQFEAGLFNSKASDFFVEFYTDRFNFLLLNNNVSYTLLTTIILLILIQPSRLFGNRFQFLAESWYRVVTDIVSQQIKDQRFIPIFVWTFGWLVVSNLAGLIPFSFTVTAQLSVTLFLALSFNIGFFIWGLFYHGLSFFKLFIPSGAPVQLLPLIVVIEIVSYLIRPLSLSLRLFANMMAGHALVHILLGFAYLVISPMILPLAVLSIFSVMLLEFGICLIQAYVFVVLCCIYLQDSFSPSH